MLTLAMAASSGSLIADESQTGVAVNRVTMDVYIRHESERCRELCDFLDSLAERRQGLDVVVHDVGKDQNARRRLFELGSKYNVEKLGLPAVHVMDQLCVGYSDTKDGQERIESLLSVEVFTRAGCPRCRDAKAFLADLAITWPALRFDIKEIGSSVSNRNRLQELARHYRVQATSVPAFHLCRQLKVGYLGPATTGREIESIIRRAARSRQPSANQPSTNQSPPPVKSEESERRKTSLRDVFRLPVAALWNSGFHGLTEFLVFQDDSQPPVAMDDLEALPELDGTESEGLDGDFLLPETTESPEMEVPYLGRLNSEHLGMPVFTILVGLVDGFNPCAMWVLMFLLSVLVNIRERKKIIVIAGTFVFVSGLAYFAFMAAWLNVFMIVGLDRSAQVILGVAAIIIGVVNVKDFLAFGKGLSFKIPESAKPGIYARVREIIAAKSMWAALSGAVVLAVLVNIVELLCTAGLPALYTEILNLQQYSPLVNYLYLGLYITAYMFDDSLLVAIVVVTLSKKKLQEEHGRWLKLLSGLVILALGVLMLVKPDWLV